MTCGQVHASYSLPEWQAVKLTFFAPCMLADFPPISWLLTTSWSTTSFRLSSMSVYKTQIVQCAQESLFFQNFTGWEMLMYHILINIIPHPFYRRTAIKLLNSVEECFRNNFQTKKLGQKAISRNYFHWVIAAAIWKLFTYTFWLFLTVLKRTSEEAQVPKCPLSQFHCNVSTAPDIVCFKEMAPPHARKVSAGNNSLILSTATNTLVL